MSEELPTSTSDLTVAGDRDPDAAMGQIGSYTLLRLLGEGGMGAVYLAEQKTPVEAVMRERQGNLPAAETLNREALALCVKKLGADHTQTALSHLRLGRVLVARKQYADAETHLLRARAIREKVNGPTAPPTQEAVDDLVKLYDAWAKPDKAKALRATS